MQLTNLSINELKAIAKENNIKVSGNKSYKVTWINSIQSHFDSITELVSESKEEAQLITEMSTEEITTEVKEAFETVGLLIFQAVKKTVEVLTSEQAIKVYKSVVKAIVISFILAYFYSLKFYKSLANNKQIQSALVTAFFVLSIGFTSIYSKFETAYNRVNKFFLETQTFPYFDLLKL